MKKVLVVDHEKCNGCTYCVLVCSMAHEGVVQRSRSRIQVFRSEEKVFFVPTLCEHCEDPPCVEACPVGAISKDSETGLVSVDENACTACGVCVEVCPYHAVRIHPERRVAVLCDLCGGEPLCAKACSVMKAIEWVEATPEALRRRSKLAESRIEALKSVLETW